MLLAVIAFATAQKFPRRKPEACRPGPGPGAPFSEDRLYACSTPNHAFECRRNFEGGVLYCSARNLVIDPAQIDVSVGGEPINTVRNRKERDEAPSYRANALSACRPSVGELGKSLFYLRDVLRQVANSSAPKCTRTVRGPTLFITRIDYANLYHTLTDWFSAYLSVRHQNVTRAESVVFLDGHAQGSLDAGWKAFGQTWRHVKKLSSPTCFERAVFVGSGYVGGISVQAMKQACGVVDDSVVAFGSWFKAQMGADSGGPRPTVGLVCRKSYEAHPRVNGRPAQRAFYDDAAVARIIEEAAPEADVIRLYFEDMKIEEQVRAVARISVLVGVHGAGLSHVVFLQQPGAVVEIAPPSYSGRPHFKQLAAWSNRSYFAVKTTQTPFKRGVRVTAGHQAVKPDPTSLENAIRAALAKVRKAK